MENLYAKTRTGIDVRCSRQKSAGVVCTPSATFVSSFHVLPLHESNTLPSTWSVW
ncbi:hypothetical protein E2C01_092381 [Portunus trituberculatus]|uniref:Uncharacterized protein n=1 Tax=Portunus trituberculatus TaxID=210409 RepID=A0A5B7JQF0_PORTR|nr:hypothetical protein [Portunus trituberculatus]